jgi:catechol 2,3-dioxygenase-like lactoylglutathione lyase family enzyme
MSNFIQITPFMHVEDLEKALTFFNDILGFETQFRARRTKRIAGAGAGWEPDRLRTGD